MKFPLKLVWELSCMAGFVSLRVVDDDNWELQSSTVRFETLSEEIEKHKKYIEDQNDMQEKVAILMEET